MKSIDPKDFKVTGKIKLDEVPTLLDIEASDDEKETMLEKVE
jgi:hypothetical protein